MCTNNCPSHAGLVTVSLPYCLQGAPPVLLYQCSLSIKKKKKKKRKKKEATLNSAENSWWTKATQNTSENVTPFQNHRDCINLQENVCCRNNFQHAGIELDVQFRGFIKNKKYIYKKKDRREKKIHMESRYHQTSTV